ncbi:O-antigen ligase domain-containing protein [Aliiroseovarius sp. S1339]|uniref:O-antigen ligase domain-containing protein n=1 Tax=Aliiroseovarius sp. S1339 TaxID=2936990 RepID=UPI0020BDF959|nr:O-antigen ligase domain-containing protein [Aliiroseovarius sp. S1339]MCK8465070.1 O-antigen ligase domain-containing protein [Aliiroseovarius sp. S1339]
MSVTSFAPQKPASLWLEKVKLPVPVFLYLLAVVTPVQFSLGPISMNGLRLLLLIMVLPLSFRLLLGKYGRLFWTDFLFVFHIIWAAVALVVNNPDEVVEFIGSASIEFIGAYVLARAYIRDVATFAAMIRVLIILVCATLPFAIYEALTSHPILIEKIRSIPGIRSVTIVQNMPRMGLDRAQVVFPHPILYGLFASVSFSLCFMGFKGIFSNVKRYTLSALITLGVFLSLSSGALLSVVLQFFLIAWAWMLRSVKGKWLWLFLLFAFIYVLIDLLSNRSPMKVFMTYATFSTHNAYYRSFIFEWGMKNVWANPIYGIGLNDWVRPRWMHTASMDNFWLVNAVRYGIPGFSFLALGYLIAILKIGLRNLGNDVVLKRFRTAWMITFVGLSFTLSTVHIWANIYSFAFFLFGSGIFFAVCDLSDNDGEKLVEAEQDRTLQYSRGNTTIERTRSQGGRDAPLTRPADTAVDQNLNKQAARADDGPKYTRFPKTSRKGKK